MTLERDIKRYLWDQCKANGFDIRKVVWENRKNAPDVRILGFLWAELKAPGKKPRKSQQDEIDHMINHGETVVVIDSMDAVDKLMETLKTWRSFSPLESIKRKLSAGSLTNGATASGASWEEVRLLPPSRQSTRCSKKVK